MYLEPRETAMMDVTAEAIARRCSVKRVFLEISQSSQENNCVRVIKKEVFSCEFSETSKGAFFTEHLRATASVRF